MNFKAMGLRVHRKKESDDYFGAALALSEQAEPLMWIRATPQGQQPCCSNLYFTANDQSVKLMSTSGQGYLLL